MAIHPIQPLELDAENTLRFKENKAVRFLLDQYQPGLNHICQFTTPEDYSQLLQLIGYTHSSIPRVTDEVWEAALRMHETGKTELECRNEVLREQLDQIKEASEKAMNSLNEVLNVY